MQTIEIEHVYKSFKGNRVLEDVSLHCESGHIYGIVGHNGSGKTVLFKCICGFYNCTQGSIKINGKIMGKEIDILPDAGIVIEELEITLSFLSSVLDIISSLPFSFITSTFIPGF